MDVTSLSNQTIKFLLELNTIKQDKLIKICKYFISLIKNNTNSILKLDDEDNSFDELLCCISTLILECAKNNCNCDQLKKLLEEIGINSNISIVILMKLYEEQFTLLKDHMENTGIIAPTIVGIDWRIDYSMHSKNIGKINSYMFLISLKIKDRNIIRYINMIANHEELQEMLSKVKDAIKQTDRVLNSNTLF